MKDGDSLAYDCTLAAAVCLACPMSAPALPCPQGALWGAAPVQVNVTLKRGGTTPRIPTLAPVALECPLPELFKGVSTTSISYPRGFAWFPVYFVLCTRHVTQVSSGVCAFPVMQRALLFTLENSPAPSSCELPAPVIVLSYSQSLYVNKALSFERERERHSEGCDDYTS